MDGGQTGSQHLKPGDFKTLVGKVAELNPDFFNSEAGECSSTGSE